MRVHCSGDFRLRRAYQLNPLCRMRSSPTSTRRIGSAAHFVPDRAACLTTPVGVRRNDLGERADGFRSALRAFGGSFHWIVGWRFAAGRFARAFEIHRCDSTPRMTSAMVRSGTCIQMNTATSRIHPTTSA